MSRFQTLLLRDGFTLRPFENQHTPDGAAMASGSPDVMTSQEPAEVQEECSGKKKSRFQTFKMFFARKKRKEPQTTEGEGGLKASQSSDNVSETSENNTLTRSEKERGSGSKISLGNKALSHDSVFVSDSSEATEGLGASQDSIHGKVKSLQLQLKQAIRLGSPPSLMCVKKTEDAGTMSEDDGLPCSPPEYTSHRAELTQAQRNGSNSLLAVDSDDDDGKRSGATSSRAVSPLVVPGDFSQPASPFGCLDNSAAKHKLGLRHKAYNKRKPASKLELNAEEDCRPEEVITIFVPGAGTMEQQVKETSEVSDSGESGDQLEPKVEREEEEEEEEEEEAAQEASHALDTSCVLEPMVSEDEVSDDQPLISSADSSRVSPEPPAGLSESSPAGVSCGAEDRDSVSEGEDVVQRSDEVASSFLEEVLSSLKTPLSSHVADEETEGVVMETKEETKEEQNKEVETDQSVEMMEEEEEVEEPVGCQDASFSSVLSDQTHEEEEELPNTYSLEEEDVEMGEKAESREEDEAVEQLTRHDGEEDESEEENHALQNHSEAQSEEEEGGAAEVMEEKPELEEEMLDVNQAECSDEEEVEEEENEGRDVEENEEEERGVVEEMGEMISDSQDEEDPHISSVQEAEGGEGGDDSASTNGEIVPEMSDQEVDIGREGQKDLNQNSEDEREDEEEEAELTEPKSEEEEVTHPDEAREDLEQEHEEIISSFTMKPVQDPEEAAEQTMVSSRPPSLSSLSPPESHPDSPSEKGPVSSSSKTTTVHINLASPSSEKSTHPFHLSPVAADPSESVCESPRPPPDGESTRSSPPEEDQGRSVWGGDDLCPASVQEVVPQPADQSKVRFTVAPAWLRSQSLTSSSTGHVSPPPPLPEPKGGDEDSTAETPSAGSPQTTAAVTTPESSVVVEGNPENPFGVRLRKTSALRRFSSEEETLEAPGEAQVQPVGVKVDSAQTPLCPPPNNKPAVPKKPEVHGDAGGKLRRISEPAAGRGGPGGSDPPSWISMANQKQKVYKENSLDEITVKKEEQERKSSLPVSVSREHSNKAKGGPSVTSTPSAFVEKETRKVFSPPTPVPPQPLKSQLLLVTPKPQAPPPTSKPPPQTNSPQMPPAPATPLHISLKSPPCTTPSQISKTATTTDTPVVTSPPFSSRTFPERPVLRAPELPLQAAFPQRRPPSPALPHDEPPWMALAKKKAKAWSEMPQIVQ
ncbi:CRACD-like protein isoform X2 [Nothobranchius furzeri]|uniref:Transcript variant X2 n=1 Tax=Nothobranchius furzeri TaxID=105023 RepID=A0A9D2YWY4_NOTFU|nr:transcript variant X2 [Nothobranchius furzeri]